MTRNNLDTYISWLLTNKVTPPVGVNSTSVVTAETGGLEHFGIQAGDLEAFEEDSDIVSSPVLERSCPPPNFARPAIRPPSASNAPSRVNSRFSDSAGMGRHEPNQKSVVPGVMSQYQLATPASTTTSTAGTSSLTQGYAQMLRKDNNATPSAKPSVERHHSRLSRTEQTPQTPRHTPRPTGAHLRNIESVDLTGENLDDCGARSSSTEIVLREGRKVWSPNAAERPEPLPRTSKKRKSDDIARSSTKKRGIRSSEKLGRQDMSLDGFMDIDDIIPRSPTQHLKPRPKALKRSIEATDSENQIQIEVTETIRRTETRTRKSISRVSSITEGLPGKQEVQNTELMPLPSARLSPTASLSKSSIKIQVAGSPVRNSYESPIVSSPSPVKAPKYERQQTQTVIQDSDDDDDDNDMMFDDVKELCSPCSTLNGKTKAVRTTNGSPVKRSGPDHEPKLEIFRDKAPRTLSPLRSISKNRVDRVASPVIKGSPSRSTLTTTPSTLAHEHTVPSSLSLEEKALVNRYLSNPSTINSYYDRIKALKSQSASECMVYTDDFEPVPPELKQARIRILDMEKAYQRMEEISTRYQEMKAEKRNVARKIYELLELDIDASVPEERQAAITKEMKVYEQEVGRLLQTSGAVDDGFGTDCPDDAPKQSLNAYESMPTHMGSSANGSAQVILQTQFPQLQQRSSASQALRDSLPVRSSPRRDRTEELETTRQRNSPSPMRRHNSADQQRNSISRPALSKFQPQRSSFSRMALPDEYDEPEDAYFEGIIEEAEQQRENQARDMGPEIEVENYGDSDDDEFLEAAQELENLPPVSVPSRPPRTPGVQLQSKDKSSNKTNTDMYAHVEPTSSGMWNFAWSKDVKKALRERFHLRGFRQNQLDAINATLSGKDVFVLMPTGGGKSLCYQLPAIINSGKTRGVTIVISPLLSLMSDQVDHLRAKHIQACLVNGEQAKEQRSIVFAALSGNHPEQFVQVLYVTPEMVGKSGQLLSAMKQLHQRNRLARIVIDEAHCVSQWGHDFRPDYKTLATLREKFPGVPFMALTATATQNVKADCIHNLGMEGCEEYKQSFNRPNLYYEIRPKQGKGSGAASVGSMIDLISKKYRGQSGIVYSLSKKNCEDLAKQFAAAGIAAHHFHAGMEPEDKTRVQRAWQTGKYQVVVATIAFGMGIDKADVRFVIHHTIPKSLEGYYQETGRAGRDGKPSGCYLYYGFQDTAVLRRFIDDSEGDRAVKEMQSSMLMTMVRYCENRNDCRRAGILAYFGENFRKEDCNNSCDNCNSDAIYETRDMTDLAKTALQIVEDLMDENVTLLYVVDILRGSKASKIKPHHQTLSGHGDARDLPRGEVERLFTRLIMDNVIVENNVVNKMGFSTPYLALGPRAWDFKRSNRRLKLAVKVSTTPLAIKPVLKRKSGPPPSTIFTSPMSPSSRRSNVRTRPIPLELMEDMDDDNFIVPDDESDEAFEPRPQRSSRSRRQVSDLGPPITTDKRMDQISEVHRDVVESFVDEAKKLESNLRNKNNHHRRYFNEADFREMAVNWTLTIEDMKELPDIDVDKVERYGKKFIPLIDKFYNSYATMMGHGHDRDMDENHRNVIDLCDDDEEEEEGQGDDEYAEEQSRFFVPNEVAQFNQQIAQAQHLPQLRHENPEPSRQQSRGQNRPRGRGGRNKAWTKKASRKSNDSNATASTSRSRNSKPAGVAKKSSTSRNTSGSFSRKTTGSIMQSFGRPSNGGGSGGGITGMPL